MAFDQIQYKNAYNRDNYDRVTILFPKGKGKVIKDFAKSKGKSTTQVVIEALEEFYRLELSKGDGE